MICRRANRTGSFKENPRPPFAGLPMIELSEAAAIAIHAMVFLSRNGTTQQPLKQIAAVTDVSDNHLSKVLQKLVKAGFIESVKGPKGGYVIREEMRSATLMSIYEAIDGEWKPRHCLFSGPRRTPCCCAMRPMLDSINKTFYDYMTGHTIDRV